MSIGLEQDMVPFVQTTGKPGPLGLPFNSIRFATGSSGLDVVTRLGDGAETINRRTAGWSCKDFLAAFLVRTGFLIGVKRVTIWDGFRLFR
jgi:hypothetical protein